MKKGNLSTQDMLGIKSFSRNGIQTNGHGEIVYFTVKPTNISVLSRVAVGIKIKRKAQAVPSAFQIHDIERSVFFVERRYSLFGCHCDLL